MAVSCASAGTSNCLMDISHDGRLLACSNRDNGTVSIVDLKSRKTIREFPVGTKPEGVSFVGKSTVVATAVYAEDKVVFHDAADGKLLATIDVFDEPYGVVSDPSGERVYVTLEYPSQVLEIDAQAHKVLRTISVGAQQLKETGRGPFLRGLAISPREERLYVCDYLTSNVFAIDLESGKTVDEWAGASTDNLARQLVIHPRRPKVYVPHIRSKVTAVHGEGSIFPYVTIVDTKPAEGRRRTRVPMDAFRGALVTANPWGAAISPDGKQFYVSFAGTDDMFACEVIDDDYRELGYRGYFRVGRNPRAIRVAPDGEHFYVYNALDFNISVWNADSLREVAKITVCKNPLSEEHHLGKVLFYSALQPMASRRWISCASCHPDGDADGRTWHNPEGLRNTQSLAGMAWTHPIHWSADRDEVQDFEHTIRGQLMQGRGLLRGRLNAQMGKPNKGLSTALDALAAYSNTHKFQISPHGKNGLSDAARRGRDVFFSKETKCATCHTGPCFTDSQPGPKLKMYDVGTGDDDPTEKMGPKYDTPSLLGAYRTAPYLHHGKAKTLRDVLTTQNKDDRHGKTSHLKDQQVADLVEFLKALPYEDPEPAAKKAGLVKVER